MRRICSYVFAVVLNLVFFAGCDESNEPETVARPDADKLNFFIQNNTSANTQFFTLDASTGGLLLGKNGTVLQFSANSFLDAANNPVNGEVEIKLIELYDLSSMVLTRKPTMGRDEQGKLSALKSGGQFFVEAEQGSQKLKLATGFTIIAPVDKTGGADENMILFDGIEKCDGNVCNLIWEEAAGEGRNVGVDGFQNATGGYSAYYAFQQKFGWTNIDRWYNDPRPKTTIFVDVPKGFDNSNCAVFMAYKGQSPALAMFDTFDAETGLFSEHYGLIPVGLEVHFILVSIINDQVHYAIQSATITENHTEVISEVTLISKEALIQLIDSLD